MDVNGISDCLRYAFPPNSLHYCGPEKQADIRGYLETHTNDKGLHGILSQFGTLYPYLQLIAESNGIRDPFDRRVVEAYWLGNRLLSRIPKRAFHSHLIGSLDIARKLPKNADGVMDGIMTHGLPHHTFHVLTIYIRTGKNVIAHTLHTMDSCRIGWGDVISANPKTGAYMISMQHLEFHGNNLVLSIPIPTNMQSVDGVYKVGDQVSVHWGYICGKLTSRQVNAVTSYTKHAIRAANTTHSFENQ